MKPGLSLEDRHLRNPEGHKLSFDKLIVYSMNVNPLNKAESGQKLDMANSYFLKVETQLETLCLNLRVRERSESRK